MMWVLTLKTTLYQRVRMWIARRTRPTGATVTAPTGPNSKPAPMMGTVLIEYQLPPNSSMPSVSASATNPTIHAVVQGSSNAKDGARGTAIRRARASTESCNAIDQRRPLFVCDVTMGVSSVTVGGGGSAAALTSGAVTAAGLGGVVSVSAVARL